jgi:hypothetical protein
LEEYKHDELIVEWIAKQFPKMITVLPGFRHYRGI